MCVSAVCRQTLDTGRGSDIYAAAGSTEAITDDARALCTPAAKSKTGGANLRKKELKETTCM